MDRTCDGCGAPGVVCDTDAGKILDEHAHLVTHPALNPNVNAHLVLMAGKVDGNDLGHTYCASCAGA